MADSLLFAEKYSELLLRNSKTSTAVELIPLLMDEYGIKSDEDIDIKRALIIAKKRMQDCPVTKPDLLSMFEAIGVAADIEHFYNDYSIKIILKENKLNLSVNTIFDILDENIRAHVAFSQERRSNTGFGLYTANTMETMAAYSLKTKLADRSYRGMITNASIVGIYSSICLRTETQT